MAITNTWSIADMTHVDADGGVFLVYWSMVAANVTGQDPEGNDVTDYTATEGGKLRCEYDASSPTYIPYADLTEDDQPSKIAKSKAVEGLGMYNLMKLHTSS